jgi:fermentation-respiration switch protein FrsA (DUF1100 family)
MTSGVAAVVGCDIESELIEASFRDRASLVRMGRVTTEYLTHGPDGLVHSGATVLDLPQLPHAVTGSTLGGGPAPVNLAGAVLDTPAMFT